MGNFLKYWPLILKFQDVTAAIGEDKSFIYTQRFWGAVIALISTAAGIANIDISTLQFTPDQITSIMVAFCKATGDFIGLAYGIALWWKGRNDNKLRLKYGINYYGKK